MRTIGITRVRNEALIIEDTLRHFLGHVDRILLYDDASTDHTPEIAEAFDRVSVWRSQAWRRDRRAEETRHRALLLDRVREIGTDFMVLCFDADERIDGILPTDPEVAAWQIPLFDGYLAEGADQPYKSGPLQDIRRLWGPERRDILMWFRADAARFEGVDRREPFIDSGEVRTASGVTVQHFGKCLSVEHWEETCDYYSSHFPEPYRSKWMARKGRAIHTASDFGRRLFEWPNVVREGIPL